MSDVSADAAGEGRFVISHLIASAPNATTVARAAGRLREDFTRTLLPHVDLLGAQASPAPTDRALMVVRGDQRTMNGMLSGLPPSTVIEPLLPRRLARVDPRPFLTPAPAARAPATTPAAVDTVLSFQLVGAGGVSAQGAAVSLQLSAKTGVGMTQMATIADAEGRVSFTYDASQWTFAAAIITPLASLWSMVLQSLVSGAVVQVPLLPTDGPMGWWHGLAGISQWNAAMGAGLRIGVADTGVGPNPALDHIIGLGSVIGGQLQLGAAEALDVDVHGSHISGILAGRPAAGSGQYGGLAPGASVSMLRIFAADGSCSQADTTLAIDYLSGAAGVDLINLSLTGAASAIEQDAVQHAYNQGAVCICAAGNEGLPRIDYPASYPDAISAAALGSSGSSPAGTLATLMQPQPANADRFGDDSAYLALFSNYGGGLSCAAGGNGIISSVPANAVSKAPQVDMGGTSMATPMTAGALALALSTDRAYGALPRGAARSAHAASRLKGLAKSIGLQAQYQGQGVPQG
jgi:subtilisin family serine protease